MVICSSIDAELDLSGFDELERELNWLETQTVEYGFINSTIKHPTAKVPVAQVADWNNSGTKSSSGNKWHIPPRPFMDLASIYVDDLMSTKLGKRIGQSFLEGKASYSKALDFIGKESADQVKYAIDEGDFKALAPSTVRRKASDTILIHSGFMYNSVDSQVIKEGD